MNGKRLRLWDLPTRLFHWLLVLAIVAAIVSGQLGGNLIVWHGRIGIFIVGLIVFRLAWGVLGSTYARFAQFFPTPARVKAQLRGEWRQPGHNPLGALSVLALLGLIGFQAVSGLFANDDIAFNGPLYDLVDGALSNRLSGLHYLASNGLYLLIALHLGAIVFYRRVKQINLVRPMLTGWHEDKGEGEDARGGGPLALIVALMLAVAAAYGASGAWLPEPPPPPAVEIPAW
ncbi:MAG: cytochrome b/b6 domain-containing protein [Pseudomonadota bacterium]|nr:cytochrome b/b6 domain-containing protein [Pseudomonadota bacterium]